jgi:hypothetical protein
MEFSKKKLKEIRKNVGKKVLCSDIDSEVAHPKREVANKKFVSLIQYIAVVLRNLTRIQLTQQ